MDFNERAKFIASFLDTYCTPVMATKGKEYSRGEDDSNSNFKRVAQAVGSDPVSVCYVYLAKHLDSIASFVKTRATSSDEPIEGRIGDAINYLLILASLLEEEKKVVTWQSVPKELTEAVEAKLREEGYERLEVKNVDVPHV